MVANPTSSRAGSCRTPHSRFSPYFRLALDERIVGPISVYLGVDLGSRVSEDGEPRRLLMVEYQTPYAFEFAN